MQLGANLSLWDIGGEPEVVRDFAQAAEAMGYDFLGAADHVVGVNAASRPDWGDRNTSADLFHDPFVLFGFLSACTEAIEFSTQVLILAQRQTALVAKQAACVDVLSGGRLRLGVGVGWNAEEFVALGEDFSNRGRRSEEQVQFLQALWAEPHVTFEGEWHRINDAGINPLPKRGRIPLWFGGHMDVTLRRAAKWGDGWIMLAYPPGDEAEAQFATLRAYTEAEGRDPAAMGLEVWVSVGAGGPDEWRREFQYWQEAGVSHITVNNTYDRGHHQRIAGRSLAEHIDGIERYRAAVADLL
ncbi:MAG: LLM class F420-dependent oxidoreductase [Alphaproteobacteria bacterium]|jgi:probable F420-dependent oxidoreductase|nr:LLM class F420-dependent oxidoreductase [Alphaproteobacteria bacterium]MDP6565000.1 LLM class F420-dependent oxidoreductase [Alphaproteobacteria bacterium]MDP6816294.1 LLM class F420-dependent oxidoreductase [Alphaproteobacteria bacterium]